MSKETGGPVYPCRIPTGELHANGDPAPTRQHYGMTMRDYFAAKAMAVVMPSVIAELQKRSYSDDKTTQLKDAAADACYGIADAMLRARGQA